MNGSSVALAVATVLAAAAYILSTRNAEAESLGGSASSNAVNKGTGYAINNPLNLRYIAGANAFNGQIGNSEGYGIYDTISNGFRAAGKQLDNYYINGKQTITAIVSTWAPASENPTAAYIASVSGTTQGNPYALNVDPNEQLAWPGDKLDLVMAMAYQENGSNPYAASDVQAYLNS
jgi:soluble lytic murein transglycosylase-like protein